jgi:hypothetical protein
LPLLPLFEVGGSDAEDAHANASTRYLNAVLFLCFEGVVDQLIDEVLGPAQEVSREVGLELLALGP